MVHHFNVEIAKLYGIEEAILVENLYFWISRNGANKNHEHEGRYWTYNSRKAFAEIFPYLTENKIFRALEKLSEKDIVVKNNFNETPYDRTCWYAFSDNGIKFLSSLKYDVKNLTMDCAKLHNGECETAQPIPDNKPNSKQEIDKSISKEEKRKSTRFVKPTVEEVRTYCEERHNGIDAEAFVAFYESKGWVVGTSPMKNWKSAIVTWEKKKRQTSGGYNPPSLFEESNRKPKYQ